MVVTDVGNEMCWWQFEDVANILKLSPIVSHQKHNVANMTVAYKCHFRYRLLCWIQMHATMKNSLSKVLKLNVLTEEIHAQSADSYDW